MLVMETLKRFVKASPLAFRLVAPLYREYQVRISRIPIAGDIPTFLPRHILGITKLRSLDEYLAWEQDRGNALARQRDEEVALLPATPGPFTFPGDCALCGKATVFECDFSYTVLDEQGARVPNLRESVFCCSCGMKNRLRAAFQIFVQEFQPHKNQPIYVTEQFGTAYRWLAGHFSDVSGSEYLSPKIAPGTLMRGIRHEDLCALSWPDSRFDFVLSFDVLEHVADAQAAFVEMFRCLRPGGQLLFTAPFSLDRSETYVMAKVEEDGSITHFCEPEYHGNPTDPLSGALCMRYFGWDTLSRLENIGYRDAKVWLYWSRNLGYLGGTQVAVTARKP